MSYLKNPATGEFIGAPEDFATSNEVWPDVALATVAKAEGDYAIVVGSGNAPNVAPLVKNKLGLICFADQDTGHGEVFKAKCLAAEGSDSLSNALGFEFARSLTYEGLKFDLPRLANFKEALHWTANSEYRELFAKRCHDTEVVDSEVELFDPETVVNITDGGKLAWLHLSNAVPYSLNGIGPHSISKDFMRFLEGVPGLSADTILTYARYSSIFAGGELHRRLVVSAERYDEVCWDDLVRI